MRQEREQPARADRDREAQISAAVIRVHAGRSPEAPPDSPESVVTLDYADQDPERWDGLS